MRVREQAWNLGYAHSVTVAVRRSDDALKWRCKTSDGRETTGSIPSTMDAKIVASAVFLDFGITDSITDKHRSIRRAS